MNETDLGGVVSPSSDGDVVLLMARVDALSKSVAQLQGRIAEMEEAHNDLLDQLDRHPPEFSARERETKGDSFAEFFDGRISRPVDTFSSASWNSASFLYGPYVAWCEMEGRHPISIRGFAFGLTSRGVEKRAGRSGSLYAATLKP